MVSKMSKWLLIVCVTYATESIADEAKLSADDIMALLPGNRMLEENPPRGGGSVSVEWTSDGQVFAKTEEGYSDKGKWWLDGDRYCRRWDKWANRKTTCWSFTLDGNTLNWYSDNGEKEGTGKLLR